MPNQLSAVANEIRNTQHRKAMSDALDLSVACSNLKVVLTTGKFVSLLENLGDAWTYGEQTQKLLEQAWNERQVSNLHNRHARRVRSR